MKMQLFDAPLECSLRNVTFKLETRYDISISFFVFDFCIKIYSPSRVLPTLYSASLKIVWMIFVYQQNTCATEMLIWRCLEKQALLGINDYSAKVRIATNILGLLKVSFKISVAN